MKTYGWPAAPPADAADNRLLDSSIGNRADTASATGSIHAKLAFIDSLVDTVDTVVDRIEVDTTSIESKVDTILARETVVTKTATLTAQGGGAGKVIDLFTLTGTVEVTAIYGECTEATDSTTLTNLLLHLFPAGGAGVDITATGTDCAGLAVGDIIRAVTSKVTATQHLKVAAAVVDNTVFAPTVLMKKTAVVTTVQAEYTSDASTDVDIKWTIRYRPLSTDGALVAA